MSGEHLMIVIHSLRGGGAERVTADLASYWAGQGCRVSVVTQTGDEDDAYPLDARVTRHTLRLAGDSGGGWRGLWANLRRCWALRRLMRRERPTVVLGMMTTASVAVSARNSISSVPASPRSMATVGRNNRYRYWKLKAGANEARKPAT